jgi:hypothetical protein
LSFRGYFFDSAAASHGCAHVVGAKFISPAILKHLNAAIWAQAFFPVHMLKWTL